MAWIKMRTDLDRDPAVIQLAEHYGWPEHIVVGLLHKLWSWADEQVKDGNAKGVTFAFLNRYLCVTDFAEQLEQVGWLARNDDGIVFPKWDIHMSDSAKKRAETAIRVAKSRSKNCNAKVVTKVLPEKRREDKRKIRDKNTPLTPQGGLSDFESVVEHYRGYHPRSRPGTKERKLAADRLKEGYSVEDLKTAIDGCHRSPFHCGENDGGKLYQSLGLILRDSGHVTQFIELATADLTVASEKTRRNLRAADQLNRKVETWEDNGDHPLLTS